MDESLDKIESVKATAPVSLMKRVLYFMCLLYDLQTFGRGDLGYDLIVFLADLDGYQTLGRDDGAFSPFEVAQVGIDGCGSIAGLCGTHTQDDSQQLVDDHGTSSAARMAPAP